MATIKTTSAHAVSFIPVATPTTEIRSRLTACAKGSYQLRLASGYGRWSGADLRGAAKKFSSRYAKSRASLLSRIGDEFEDVLYVLDRNRHGLAVVIAREEGIWYEV